MKKILAGASISLMATFSGAVEVGTGIWQQSTTGTVANNSLNLDSDLGLKSSNDMYLYVNVNMPLMIPNIKFRTQALTATGSGTIPASLLGGFAGIPNADILALQLGAVTTLDMTYTDVVTHYGLPLPMLDLDFGLNFRFINGSFALADNTSSGVPSQKGDFVVPLVMGHVAAGMKLPMTGLSVYGEYNLLPLGETNVTDLMIKARYELPLPTLVLDLGVEVGYHDFTMDIGASTLGADTSDLASKISSKGMFVGVSANF